MKRELSEVVNDGVTCVCTALKADYDVAFVGENVGNFSLTLVAPVCAYYCFYHSFAPLINT